MLCFVLPAMVLLVNSCHQLACHTSRLQSKGPRSKDQADMYTKDKAMKIPQAVSKRAAAWLLSLIYGGTSGGYTSNSSIKC